MSHPLGIKFSISTGWLLCWMPGKRYVVLSSAIGSALISESQFNVILSSHFSTWPKPNERRARPRVAVLNGFLKRNSLDPKFVRNASLSTISMQSRKERFSLIIENYGELNRFRNKTRKQARLEFRDVADWNGH